MRSRCPRPGPRRSLRSCSATEGGVGVLGPGAGEEACEEGSAGALGWLRQRQAGQNKRQGNTGVTPSNPTAHHPHLPHSSGARTWAGAEARRGGRRRAGSRAAWGSWWTSSTAGPSGSRCCPARAAPALLLLSRAAEAGLRAARGVLGRAASVCACGSDGDDDDDVVVVVCKPPPHVLTAQRLLRCDCVHRQAHCALHGGTCWGAVPKGSTQ